MKLFVTIWALFIFGLGCIPCTDSVISCQDTATHSEKQDTPHSKDSCTPFCSCMCHGAIITDFSTEQNETAVIKHLTKAVIFYKTLHSEAHLNAIWQPPTFH